MSIDRWILTMVGLERFPHFTYQRDDHYREAAGPKWPGRLLRFFDDSIGGRDLTPGDGPVAGAVAGHPLYLLFWGGWWDGPGAARRAEIIKRTQQLLSGSYFSSLQQYGIQRAPNWAGALTVQSPDAPGVTDHDTANDAMFDMIEDLISDGKLPARDSHPRPLYIVCAPDTFSCTSSDHPVGWHDSDTDWFRAGTIWAALVKPDDHNDPKIASARTMITLTHELVEMMTDPEPNDGWSAGGEEASDAAERIGPKNIRQTACLDGLWVEAYWSNSEHGNVIPLEDGYKAWLSAHITEDTSPARDIAAEGTFRPDPGASAGCGKVSACCIEDRDYAWRVYRLAETARVTLHTERFCYPHIAWSIQDYDGSPIPLTAGGPPIVVHKVHVDSFTGRNPVTTVKDVTLRYILGVGDRNVYITADAGGDFQVPLTCVVRESVNFDGKEPQPISSPQPDSAITGYVVPETLPTVTVQMSLDFKGEELVLEDAYMDQVQRCLTAMAQRALHDAQRLPSTKIHVGDPIDQIVNAGLPAQVRPSEFARIQVARLAARGASLVLTREAHQRYVDHLIASIPALARRRPAANRRLRKPLRRPG